jgi:ribosomal protein S27E
VKTKCPGCGSRVYYNLVTDLLTCRRCGKALVLEHGKVIDIVDDSFNGEVVFVNAVVPKKKKKGRPLDWEKLREIKHGLPERSA